MAFENDREDLIEGRNAVLEALKAARPIDKIYIARGELDKAFAHIASTARAAGIVVVDADRRKLDQLSVTGSHQGVVALAAVREYCTIPDIIKIASDMGEPPFIIACDEISDPHNLGAIIRTAKCAGAHGIIIPKRRSAGLTAITAKASAGAAEHMAVARVSNLSSAFAELKEAGMWIYGADSAAENDLWHTDLTGALCLVIGSEGDGISRLVKENCDALVNIPMTGDFNSLNASCAAAILIYEALRQRI